MLYLSLLSGLGSVLEQFFLRGKGKAWQHRSLDLRFREPLVPFSLEYPFLGTLLPLGDGRSST